ncbi:MAG: hypothetical protein ABI901_06830, partial [Roseiflexaceae bacterium]
MIRRTLINRARRQRDLARTLIARHSLMAYGRSQPQLGDRPAVLNDDFFAFASSAEAAASVLDEIGSPANDFAVLMAALPEVMIETEPVPFNPAQSVAPALEAMIAPEHVPDVAVPVPASAVTSVQPDVAADQRAGNTLADLVRRMRDPAWVAPAAAAPATTTPASAAPKPTTSQHVADLVHQMQEPPQRTTPRAERPRIPLGQRMSEAADFGQTPATPHHVDQLAAPAHDEPPAEAAAGQPAQVVFKTEYTAAERSGGDVGHVSEPIQPVESADWLPIIVGANAVTVAPMLTSESPGAVAAHPNAPAPNPRAPLNEAEPPTEHRALSQKLQADATLAAAAAIPPSQAPAAAIANSLQNLDAPVALPPPATSDLLSPVDIPPATTNDLGRPAANVDQIDTASRRVTPAVEYPQALDLPPVQPSDAHTQPALATFAAGAPATSPIA